jgi:hypothetical protein
MSNALPDEWPAWDDVLSAAARLQKLIPDAVLVGGTASASFAGHRISLDADHVLPDPRSRFDRVLAELESVSGWQTARVNRPVLILGSLDGIETGVRQLIRMDLPQYKHLDPRWHDWQRVRADCAEWATRIFDRVCELRTSKGGG